MAEYHLWGISHLSADRVFILRESVEIGAERMTQGIMRPRLYTNL